jgi:hypothetical protein
MRDFGQSSSTIKLSNITTHDIEKIIHSLKCKNSCGYVEISPRILKISAPYVLSSLTYIFSKFLLTGIFPERLKFSEMKPLYKIGGKTEFSNYRSIHSYHHFPKSLKKSFIKDCIAT